MECELKSKERLDLWDCPEVEASILWGAGGVSVSVKLTDFLDAEDSIFLGAGELTVDQSWCLSSGLKDLLKKYFCISEAVF